MEYFIPSQVSVNHIQESFQLLTTNWKWSEDIFSKQFSKNQVALLLFFPLNAEYYLKTSKEVPFQCAFPFPVSLLSYVP